MVNELFKPNKITLILSKTPKVSLNTMLYLTAALGNKKVVVISSVHTVNEISTLLKQKTNKDISPITIIGRNSNMLEAIKDTEAANTIIIIEDISVLINDTNSLEDLILTKEILEVSSKRNTVLIFQDAGLDRETYPIFSPYKFLCNNVLFVTGNGKKKIITSSIIPNIRQTQLHFNYD